MIQKKEYLYSLILGEASSWFLILVIKNPYIEEFRQLLFLQKIIWWLPFAFPLIFAAGILLSGLLAKVIKVFRQVGRFVEVGILNTLIDFGILNLLIWATGITGGLAIAPLNAASFLVATTNSYFWNKFWTFEAKKETTGKEFSKFLVISAIGIGLNTGIVVAGTSLLLPWFGLSAGAWANVIKALAIFISMAWNFLGYKFVVFKK